jgi:hypothetical protein
VAGVVNQDVDATVLAEYSLHGSVDGVLEVHVELDSAQVGAAGGGEIRRGLDLRGVAAAGVAHAGVDDVGAPVAGVGQRAGGEGAEAAGGAGDEDDLLAHGSSRFGRGRRGRTEHRAVKPGRR